VNPETKPTTEWLIKYWRDAAPIVDGAGLSESAGLFIKTAERLEDAQRRIAELEKEVDRLRDNWKADRKKVKNDQMQH